MKNQAGFTLIELVMVIAILGILSTIAIPIYIDMRNSAALSNVSSVGGTISSASTLNFSAKLSGAGSIAFNNCKNASVLLTGNLTPPNGGSYEFSPDAIIANGEIKVCTITLKNASPNNQSYSFSVFGVS